MSDIFCCCGPREEADKEETIKLVEHKHGLKQLQSKVDSALEGKHAAEKKAAQIDIEKATALAEKGELEQRLKDLEDKLKEQQATDKKRLEDEKRLRDLLDEERRLREEAERKRKEEEEERQRAEIERKRLEEEKRLKEEADRKQRENEDLDARLRRAAEALQKRVDEYHANNQDVRINISEGKIEIKRPILFENKSDSFLTGSESQKLLQEVADAMNLFASSGDTPFEFNVDGHTANPAVELSEQRAKRVVAELVANNVDSNLLYPRWFSDSQLMNPDDKKDPLNKRVEFTVHRGEKTGNMSGQTRDRLSRTSSASSSNATAQRKSSGSARRSSFK
ncbi:hypothetical protein CYMTET_23730 [Cymbomonas tetramitiformis]|uniref:OmpA-like domain-containing protein n=1 Tax=Cymbomonas tetramitiformis TaxID=36881 RepID=A0AAE0FX67_9CHLO|nr:hypothetical protein CYMTET_23730 [Cymbomonas tetramitiformis]|eukprot:gene18457-22024_t